MTSPVRLARPSIASTAIHAASRALALTVASLSLAVLAGDALAGGVSPGCAAPNSGNNQTVVEGSRVQAPLQAVLQSVVTPASPSESITWTANPNTVRFGNGTNTTTTLGTWTFNSALGVWEMFVQEQPYVGLGTGSFAIVNLTNPSCVATTLPFNINVLPLQNPTAQPLDGNGIQVYPSTFSPISVIATHDVGGNTLAAVEVPFIFNITNGPASFNAVESVLTNKVYTDGAGIASNQIWIEPNAQPGQTIDVTANAPGYPTVNFTMTVGTPVTFGNLVVESGDGQVLAPNSTSEIVVVSRPLVGRGLRGGSVTFDVLLGDVVFAETGSTHYVDTDVDADGFYSFVMLAGDTPGPVTVRASSSGFNDATITAEIQTLGALQTVSGDGQSGEVGTVLAQPLTVRVPTMSTPNGRRLGKAAQAVEFRVTGGQGVFVGNNQPIIQSTTDANGEASAQLRLGFEIGSVTVTASAPGYLPVTFNLTATAPGTGVPVTLVRKTAPVLGAPGTTSDPLVVYLSQGGVGLVGQRIDWQLISGDATLTQDHSFTDNVGDASNTVVFGPTGDTVVVRASHQVLGTNLLLSTDFTLAGGVAAPVLTVVSGNGQTGPVGSLLDHPIEFQLLTLGGTPLVNEVVNFSVSGPGTLLSTSTHTDSNGKASVGLRFGTTAGVVTVTATAPIGPVTASATVSSFVPNIAIVSGNNQSGAAGSLLPQPLVIKLSGNAAPLAKGFGGITVRWNVTCGNGTVQAATTTTNASGESQNRWTLGPNPGCNRVEAKVDGVGTVNFTANATIAGDSVLEIVSGNGQSLVPLQPSAPLKVRLRSAGGTPIAGVAITFATGQASATLSPGEALTASDGTAETVASIVLPSTLEVVARVRDVASIAPVTFTLNNGVANLPNLTPEQEEVADAIDNGCPQLAAMQNLSAAEADLLARCSEVVVNAGDDPEETSRALNEMLADEATGQNTAALAAANAQFDNLKARMAALRSGSRGVDLAGLNILAPGGSLPLSLLPSAIALTAGEPPEEIGSEFTRWGFFATGTIGRGDRDPQSLDPGFRYDSYGITAGVDYRLTDSWILGAALGFNRNNTELRQNQGGMDTKGWTLSGYASFFKGSAWYADAVASFGRNNYDIDRRISYGIDSLTGGRTLIDQIASASPDGNQQSLALSLGRDFNKGAWTFGPYLRAAYTKIDFDAYSETMSNPTGAGAGLALSVDSRELKSLQGVVGGKLSYAVSTSWGILLPSAQIEWVNEFENDPELLVTRFLHDPSETPILIESTREDDNFFNLGLGLSGVFASGKSAYLYFEHVAGQDRMSSNSLAIGVRIEF
jgi:outer membrane autotransporter protein